MALAPRDEGATEADLGNAGVAVRLFVVGLEYLDLASMAFSCLLTAGSHGTLQAIVC
jgi:hypothetical protein